MKSCRIGEGQKKTDAASPVIGVILIVAITVILAAVIGTTVIGISDQNEPAEKAVVDVLDVREKSGSPNEVLVHIVTIDDVENDELYLAFKDTQIQHEGGPSYAGPANRLSWKKLGNTNQQLSAGDRVWFEPPDAPQSNEKVEGREVVVIYDDGDTEAIVYEFGALPGP